MARILTNNSNILSTGSVNISSTGSTNFIVDGRNLLFLTSSNYVGVYNTSPSYTLDTGGDTNTSGSYRIYGRVIVDNNYNFTASNLSSSGFISASSFNSNNLTAKGVLFSDGKTIVNNANKLYWDNTNFSLGLGTSSLNAILHINANNSGDSNFLLEKLAGQIAYSITPWTNQIYIGAGTYYKNSNWITQNAGNTTYQLFSLYPSVGATWFAYGAMVNPITDTVTLWNDSGSWVGKINNTSITSSAISASSITGSLYGTSSWANKSISASYSSTASYIIGAISSASYALSSSYGLSSSYALTASYITASNIIIKLRDLSDVGISTPQNGDNLVYSHPYWQNSSVLTASIIDIDVPAAGNFVEFNVGGINQWVLKDDESMLILQRQNSDYTLQIQQDNTAQFYGAVKASLGFHGDLTGTASWSEYALNCDFAKNAYTASAVDVAQASANKDYYLTFLPEITASQLVYCDSARDFKYNPSTNTLTCPNITGTASYATSASYASNGLSTGSSYPITASWATTALTASSVVGNISCSVITASLFNGTAASTRIPFYSASGVLTSSANLKWDGTYVNVPSEGGIKTPDNMVFTDSSDFLLRFLYVNGNWTDNQNAVFFQAGRSNGNMLFTSKYGALLTRTLFCSTKTSCWPQSRELCPVPLGVLNAEGYGVADIPLVCRSNNINATANFTQWMNSSSVILAKIDNSGSFFTSGSITGSSMTATTIMQLPYSASGKALTPSAITGSAYINATNNLLYVYNGTAWKSASLA